MLKQTEGLKEQHLFEI